MELTERGVEVDAIEPPVVAADDGTVSLEVVVGVLDGAAEDGPTGLRLVVASSVDVRTDEWVDVGTSGIVVEARE